jgi:PleD family two-component response regulator
MANPSIVSTISQSSQQAAQFSSVQFSSVQFSIGISFREEEEEEEEEATTSCTAIQYKAKQSKAKLTLH